MARRKFKKSLKQLKVPRHVIGFQLNNLVMIGWKYCQSPLANPCFQLCDTLGNEAIKNTHEDSCNEARIWFFCQLHLEFPSVLPSKHYPGPIYLNFSIRIGTGVSSMAWSAFSSSFDNCFATFCFSGEHWGVGHNHWFLFVVVTSFILTLLWCFFYLLQIKESISVNLPFSWLKLVRLFSFSGLRNEAVNSTLEC